MTREGAEPVARTARALGLIGVIVAFALVLGRGHASHVTGSAPGGNWETVLVETFDGELGPGWTAVDASDGESGNVTWGTSPYTYTSPEYSAWSVGGGIDGSQLEPGSPYPDEVDAWLVYGPVDLGGVHEAYLEFQWWLETGDVAGDPAPGAGRNLRGTTSVQTVERVGGPPTGGDWFGWCVLTEEMDFETARCEYVSGAIARWLSASMCLRAGGGDADEVWIGFHFVSDGDVVAGRGAFVDDVTVLVRRDYHAFLPLLRREPTPTPEPTPTNEPPSRGELKNRGFEADWAAAGPTHRTAVYRDDGSAREENPEGIRTPPGWLTWFRDIPHTWQALQGHSVVTTEDERRVHRGHRAVEIATNWRPYDAGLLQQVDVSPGLYVQPGSTVRLTAWAHAWSNNGGGPPGQEDDPGWSEGAGFDCFYAVEGTEGLSSDLENFTLRVGIDPTGGVDPDAPTVVWGDGAHIYNCYHEVPAVQAEAQSRRVTVFLRSRAQWGFKHNHAYWDDVELSVVGGGEGGDGSDWPYPVFERGSRIGVHSILPGEVGRFAEELVTGGTRFPVVKAVDDLGWLKGIKESSPETILVARVVDLELEGCPNVEDPETDLDEMARGLLSFILNRLSHDARLRGVVEYWEVVNEPDPPGPDGDPNNPEGYRRLAELMIRCMEKAERYGLKLALFSLNAGTPEWNQMEAMVETGVFARAREGGHILALHEGTFGDTYDPRDGWGGSIPGAPDVEGAGSMNFRYRYLYHLLEQRDEVIPLVVSEWYCGDVREEQVDTQTIIDALVWYDDEAKDDHYFWATCPFTLGTRPGMWDHSDWERFYPGLLQHMIAIRDRENPLPPAQSLWETLLRMLGWR